MHRLVVISALFFAVNAHRPHDFLNYEVDKANKCDSINLDPCGYKIYGLNHRPSVFPKNQVELDEACKSMNEGLECVKQRMDECPTIITPKLSTKYLRDLSKIIRVICEPGGLGEKLIPFGGCYQTKLKNFTCAQQFFDAVEAAREEATPEEQLFTTCCASDKYGNCTNKAISLYCGPEASAAKSALTLKLSGFLVDDCLPVQQEEGYQLKCAHFRHKPLPLNHRKVTNVLPALIDIYNIRLGF